MPKRSRNGEVSNPGARCRAYQGKWRQVQLYRPRGRPFADHDVELIVFHGRIEDFLDGRAQTMDFVDEQHIARTQIGQYRGKVPRFFHHRTGSTPDRAIHLVGDDSRQRGLAKSGRTENQGMVKRLAALAGGADEYLHLLLDLLLTYIIQQTQRSQRVLDVLGTGFFRRNDSLFHHEAPAAPGAMLCRASRIRSSGLLTPG